MGTMLQSVRHMMKRQKSSEDYYTEINTDIVGIGGKSRKKWMNVGYWENAEHYIDACEALADKLAHYGDFYHADSLLDVGCGCGEQDFYWKECFPNLSIQAMDITPLHIEIANERKRRENSEIRFSVGSGTDLPVESCSVSRVSALDCAYHFDPREKFLEEAYRVLEPGGRLAVSEMLPVRGEKTGSRGQIKGRAGLFLPECNMYPVEEYVKKLEHIGYRNISFEAVGGIVYKGLVLYFAKRYLQFARPIDEVRIRFDRNRRFGLYRYIYHRLFGTSEYYFITGEKPGEKR